MKVVASSLRQPWSSSLSTPAGLGTSETQTFDRMRPQGTVPYPSILGLFYPLMSLGWTPPLLGLTMEVLPSWLLSCQGGPSYLAMGSPSCAKHIPVRTSLDPSPGPGSASFI